MAQMNKIHQASETNSQYLLVGHIHGWFVSAHGELLVIRDMRYIVCDVEVLS